MQFVLMPTIQGGLCWGLVIGSPKGIHVWEAIPVGWFTGGLEQYD